MPAGLIIIAADGSPAADKAVELGLELAVGQKSAVVFMHFSPEIAHALPDTDPEIGPTQADIEAADPVLKAAAQAARSRGVGAKLMLVGDHGAGDIAAWIAGTADGLGASMIVVGTRGRGPIGSAVLGSVSRSLLSYSELPVVVVHAGKDGSQPAE